MSLCTSIQGKDTLLHIFVVKSHVFERREVSLYRRLYSLIYENVMGEFQGRRSELLLAPGGPRPEEG